jgi:hypothetical protein
MADNDKQAATAIANGILRNIKRPSDPVSQAAASTVGNSG